MFLLQAHILMSETFMGARGKAAELISPVKNA